MDPVVPRPNGMAEHIHSGITNAATNEPIIFIIIPLGEYQAVYMGTVEGERCGLWH